MRKKTFVHPLGLRRNVIVGTKRAVPSGQYRSILPARVANHSTGFGSSCPLAEIDNKELTQRQRRRQGERHLEMKVRVSAIVSQLFQVIILAKCVLTILELNENQRFRDKKTKLNICHHMLTSSTQLQNTSFHVVERTRTSAKSLKMKNSRAKHAKQLFFIVKYANL